MIFRQTSWSIIKNWIVIIKISYKTPWFIRSHNSKLTIDAGVQKKIYGSGTTTFVVKNAELNNIMKIILALEDSSILLKGLTKTISIKRNLNPVIIWAYYWVP